MYEKAKTRLHGVLNPASGADSTASRGFGAFLVTLILLNVVAVVMETVEAAGRPYRVYFRAFEVFSVAAFTIEYAARIWTCTADERYRGTILGRLRFAITPLALIDLMAILPFYVPAFIPLDLRYLRAIRLLRLFRALKMARYSDAQHTVGRVLRSKREELLVTAFAGVLLLVLASGLMYAFEREAQPEKFGSIPAAMWWAVITLTTVGYGDIYPITTAGKMAASAVTILGIGFVALPAGILASGFVQELQRKRETPTVCPHCGKEITRPSHVEGKTDS